jgi:hypothetical protein
MIPSPDDDVNRQGAISVSQVCHAIATIDGDTSGDIVIASSVRRGFRRTERSNLSRNDEEIASSQTTLLAMTLA